jgi:hypothetical protein
MPSKRRGHLNSSPVVAKPQWSFEMAIVPASPDGISAFATNSSNLILDLFGNFAL